MPHVLPVAAAPTSMQRLGPSAAGPALCSTIFSEPNAGCAEHPQVQLSMPSNLARCVHAGQHWLQISVRRLYPCVYQVANLCKSEEAESSGSRWQCTPGEGCDPKPQQVAGLGSRECTEAGPHAHLQLRPVALGGALKRQHRQQRAEGRPDVHAVVLCRPARGSPHQPISAQDQAREVPAHMRCAHGSSGECRVLAGRPRCLP